MSRRDDLDFLRRSGLAILPAAVGIVLSAYILASAADQNSTAQTIAAQLRDQGFACDRAEGADRAPAASRPDEQVWILRCSNASYRVRLIPDMAAQVERIE